MSNNRARSKSAADTPTNHPEAYRPLPPKNDLSRIKEKQRERANPWMAQPNPRLTPNREDVRPNPQVTPNRQERQQQPTPPTSQQNQRGQQQGSGLSDPRLNRRPNVNVIRVNAPNPVPPPIGSTPRPPQQSRQQNLQAPVQQNRNNNTATKSSRSVANPTPPNQQKENRNAIQFGQGGQAARTPANFQAAQQNRNNNNPTNPSKSVPGIAFAARRPTPNELSMAKENRVAGPTPTPRIQSGRTSPFGHGRGGQAVQPVRASQNFQTAQQHKTNNNTTKPSKSAAAGCLAPRSTTPNQAFSTATAAKENQGAFAGRERGLTQPALYDSQIRSGPRGGQAVHAEQQQQHIPVRVTTPNAASAELPAQFDPTRPPPPIPPLSAVRFFNNYNWSRTNPRECAGGVGTAGGGQRVGGQRSFVQSNGPSPAMGFRSNLDNSANRQHRPSRIDTTNREFGKATHGRQPTVERQLPPQRSMGDHRLELEADEPAVVVAADSVEFLESNFDNSTPRPRKRANTETPNEVGQKRVRTSTTPTRATPPNQTPPAVDQLAAQVQLAEEIDTYAIETDERDEMTQWTCDLFMKLQEDFATQLAMRQG